MNDQPSTLPPGAKEVPNAGVNYPNHDTKAAEPTKRDAKAAGELPELYRRLHTVKEILARVDKETVDTHTVQFNLGGEGMIWHPHDRGTFNDLIKADLKAAVDGISEKIKSLGFDVA